MFLLSLLNGLYFYIPLIPVIIINYYCLNTILELQSERVGIVGMVGSRWRVSAAGGVWDDWDGRVAGGV